MSLMRNSIAPFVAKQLGIREQILSLGGEGNRFDSINAYGMDLPKGAFYSYAVSKQATIRMYSGVDIQPGTFPKYKDELTGVPLAKQFVLEGGAGTDFTFNEIKKGDDVKRAKEKFDSFDQKSGFARSAGAGWSSGDKLYTGAYGNTHFRAHPHKGYGIVPMPGILDADIRTVSDFGSLRLAKVNFVCYNLPQLEVLEMLYMRPGYPVLIEWGWTPYISNITGKLETDIPLFNEFWDSDSNLFDMHTKLIKLKKKRSGNYDNVLGFVKNFEYNARHDGGFDCFTEVMGYGEVMQGIQGRKEVPLGGYFQKGNANQVGTYIPESTTKSATKNGTTRIEIEKTIVPDWILGSEESSANLDNFAWIISALAYYTRPVTYTNGVDHLPTEINKADFKAATGWDGTPITRQTNSFERAVDQVIKYLTEINPNTDYKRAARDITDHYCVNGSYFNNKKYPPYGDPSLGTQTVSEYEKNRKKEDIDITRYNPDDPSQKFTYDFTDTVYLRWDFLVEIMNKFVVNQHKESKDESAITKYTVFNSDASYEDMETDAKFADGTDHPLQGERRWSLDAYVKMAGAPMLDFRLQKDFEEFGGKDLWDEFVGSYASKDISRPGWLAMSFDPKICIFPGQTQASHGLATAGSYKYGEGQWDIWKYNSKTTYSHHVDTQDNQTAGGASNPPPSTTTTYSNKYGNPDEGNELIYHKHLRIPRGNYESVQPFINSPKDPKELDKFGANSSTYNNSLINDQYRDHLGLTNRYIGLIYIEYKWLIELWKKEFKKKDFGYFDFWSKVWKEISENACVGNHEFILHTDETNSTIRVIDVQNDPTRKPPSKIHSFKVQDKGSIVRDFTFQSSIPDSISSTIAIAAQSPDSFNSTTTTLSAFSNNIKSRFSNFTGASVDDKMTTYKDLIQTFMIKHVQLARYSYYIHQGWWFFLSDKLINSSKGTAKEYTELMHQLNNIQPAYVNTNENDEVECDQILGFFAGSGKGVTNRNANKYPVMDEFGWLMNRWPHYCKYKDPTWENQGEPVFNVSSVNVQNTDLIPINVSLTMDGISGIRIGDVVKINNPKGFERLPRAYQRDDVYFVVMGDSHRITSGQDWEQEISLQLTLIGDLEYGHQTAVSVVSKKAEIEKEEEVLVDAIGNPRTRTIVRQPTGWINPVSNVGISTTGNQSWGQGQDFGERVLKGKNDFHNGVDIVPGVNKNGVKDLGIYMVKKAKVIAVVNQGNSGCGKGLKFQFTDVGANEPEYGMYCHLDSYNTHKNGDPIEVGNIINQGERIGTMGTSGGVAIHLHYGLNLGNKSFSSDEENTGVDPAYFLSGEDNVTDLREGLTYNHYDINGLIRDIKDYVEYSQGASPDADVQAAKVSFIRDNYNFPSNTHVSNPISEYMTTGTLKAENYPNLPSAPSIGTLKL